jgi:hypothetical protein
MNSQLTVVHILTAHFGDFEWTSHLIRKLKQTTDFTKYKLTITIVDQDRSVESKLRLKSLGDLNVVQVKQNQDFFNATGHDHPWALDKTWNDLDGDTIILFDCDAHPMRAGWLEWTLKLIETHGAVLAEDHLREGKSHPCFMAMNRSAAGAGISFSEGVLKNKEDTGRRVFEQLRNKGFEPVMLRPERRFCKIAGIVYNDWIYHHGSGTFHTSEDSRLIKQVNRYESIVKSLVINDEIYEFPIIHMLYFRILREFVKLIAFFSQIKYNKT